MNDREGGDITAADMMGPEIEPSKILEFFDGTTIFVTGATGFLGKLLVEKMLRTCTNINKIYILLRPKNGKTFQQRFEEYFDDPLYERLKRERLNAIEKIAPIEGDCGAPNLGLKPTDEKKLMGEVECIFHLAAAARFDETLRNATLVNVRGVLDMLKLAKRIKNLRSIVYVSTAFSFCPRRTIDEIFYKPTITGDKLLTLLETLDVDKVEKVAPTIIEDWPSTYTFTKSIAENCIKTEGVGLPIVIVRPSNVASTSKEPVAGWIDNFYGPIGIFVALNFGIMRTLNCNIDYLAEIVPADYVINVIIAATWDIAEMKGCTLNMEFSEKLLDKFDADIPIYNYVSTSQKPLTWRECAILAHQHMQSVPSPLQLWHYMFWPTSNETIHFFRHYFLHLLPAHILDWLGTIFGKQTQLVQRYKKIDNFAKIMVYFGKRQWIFRNSNTQGLWEKLNCEDKKLFEFNMANHDWDSYFETAMRGGRVYLMKDPLDTIPKGQITRFKFKIVHHVLFVLLLIIMLLTVYVLLSVLL